MQEQKQTLETVKENVVVVYVVARCPHCGAVFTDFIHKTAHVSDGFIKCPICGRAIVPGGEDEGEDFE